MNTGIFHIVLNNLFFILLERGGKLYITTVLPVLYDAEMGLLPLLPWKLATLKTKNKLFIYF